LNPDDLLLRETPFFRRFNYDGPLSLKRIDTQTAVDADCGFLGHLNPKAANSSIAAALGALSLSTKPPLDQATKRMIRRELRRPSTLSPEEVEAVPTMTSFVCIRNPYSRTLSAFLSKVVGKQQKHAPRRGHPVVARPEDFRSFAESLTRGALTDNFHWAPQHWFLLFPLEDYDHVMRFESLNTDFHALQQDIFGPGPCQLPAEDPGHATDATAQLGAFFDSASEQAVFDAYRLDFELLGYPRGVGL